MEIVNVNEVFADIYDARSRCKDLNIFAVEV